MRKDNVLEAIGDTPLVEIARMSPKSEVRIFAKLEGQNVGGSGSVKDRIAKYMIEKAEESGELTHDKIILEGTSGNTGIALAMIGRRKDYRVSIVMPDNATKERKQLLELYGAEIILSEGAKGTNGAVELATKLAEDNRYYMPYQFGNPANPLAHYETTGAEIIRDLAGLEIDAFVAGIGTGGTLMGAGRRLKEVFPKIKVIGVEPHPGEPIAGLRSLAEGFFPPIIDLNLIDERVVVHSADALARVRELVNKEGIFCGPSSGAVLHQAIRVAEQMERGVIVCILPDGGWKYLSMPSLGEEY